VIDGFEPILPVSSPYQHLILAPDISEIMVNGPEKPFIEKAGYVKSLPGVKLTPRIVASGGQEHCQLVERRILSKENSILDSQLPGGSRVTALSRQTLQTRSTPSFRSSAN